MVAGDGEPEGASSSGRPNVWNAMRSSTGYTSRPVTVRSTTALRHAANPRSGAVMPCVCSSPLSTWTRRASSTV
ncbi:Uncharacterised protein [Mycobacteroides abscessus]|nr:Uncharacterised protein [Mycobacteroides abscessus]